MQRYSVSHVANGVVRSGPVENNREKTGSKTQCNIYEYKVCNSVWHKVFIYLLGKFINSTSAFSSVGCIYVRLICARVIVLPIIPYANYINYIIYTFKFPRRGSFELCLLLKVPWDTWEMRKARDEI